MILFWLAKQGYSWSAIPLPPCAFSHAAPAAASAEGVRHASTLQRREPAPEACLPRCGTLTRSFPTLPAGLAALAPDCGSASAAADLFSAACCPHAMRPRVSWDGSTQHPHGSQGSTPRPCLAGSAERYRGAGGLSACTGEEASRVDHPLGIPGHFPQMPVRILEVARVPAPPGVMRRFDHDGPGRLGP